MSTKEKIYHMIDTFPESQLEGVLKMLEGLKSLVSEAEDDAYCARLYDDYKAEQNDEEELTDIVDLAKELGVSLQ